ncbi:hypothetical protein H5993_08510 [Lactobacillus alvi]|uniref:Uncharacterized protein n=1 Tax=Limosilactobacillus alvi TaxID=990412 RepID=A0ABS2EQM3_9LACO|nr:hypothetical protein [Limosilactobacillus alvi]MBM6754797.1 hypothetical protein [Limosilactobacillus alvi]
MKKTIKFYDDETAHRVAQHFFDTEYEDPGIEKWSGFLLSDHTAKLNQQETNDDDLHFSKPEK